MLVELLCSPCPPETILQARQLLVTVGLEEPGISTATIKIWESDRVIAAAANATAANSAAAALSALPQAAAVSTTAASLPPLRIQKVFSSKYPESEVTALAVADSGASSLVVTVGLAAGSVYLFTGDISSLKGKLHHTGKLNVRPDAGDLWRVSALAFKEHKATSSSSSGRDKTSAAAGSSSTSSSAASAGTSKIAALSGRTAAAEATAVSPASEPEQQWLFVVTESQTLVFNMADQSKTILDQQGLSCGACAVLRDGLLMVARDDALYEYTTDTRAGCTAFDGKHHLNSDVPEHLLNLLTCIWYWSTRLHQLACLSTSTVDALCSTGIAGVKQGLGLLKRCLYVVTDDTSPDGAATSILHLVDVKNKLVVGAFPLQGLSAVVVGPGGLAAWCLGGRLYRYFEVELATQVRQTHSSCLSC